MLISQYAKTGYPAAGFPQVEPFLIKRFDISDGRTGSLNLKLNFKDVNVEGLSGVKFDRAVWVLNKEKYQISSFSFVINNSNLLIYQYKV